MCDRIGIVTELFYSIRSIINVWFINVSIFPSAK